MTFSDLVFNTVLPLLQGVVVVILSLTVLYILWSGIQMIIGADNAQRRADLRSSLIWGVIVIFIMVSVWGIIEIMQVSLGVG